MTEEDIKHLEDDSAPISDEERVQAARYIRQLHRMLEKSTEEMVKSRPRYL